MYYSFRERERETEEGEGERGGELPEDAGDDLETQQSGEWDRVDKHKIKLRG